ncbi:MAG: hypothetical protein ACRCRW_11855, partial [Aeromonadaceae bacterium]
MVAQASENKVLFNQSIMFLLCWDNPDLSQRVAKGCGRNKSDMGWLVATLMESDGLVVKTPHLIESQPVCSLPSISPEQGQGAMMKIKTLTAVVMMSLGVAGAFSKAVMAAEGELLVWEDIKKSNGISNAIKDFEAKYQVKV